MSETKLLLREGAKLAKALGRTLAPFCEVVLHDLTTPRHAIVHIENNLSGRKVGDAATELGLARIADPQFPEVIVNYKNRLPDGRSAKSTSIGLRDSSGRFVGAICLNIDVSYLADVLTYVEGFIKTNPVSPGISETLAPTKRRSIELAVREFAVRRNTQPRALTPADRRGLLAELRNEGLLELRGAVSQVAGIIGVSRTVLYHYLNKR